MTLKMIALKSGDRMDNNIDIKNLEVVFQTPFGEVTAIKNLTKTFKANCITGVIGESGSGKSVMGMSILRLLPATAQIKGSCHYARKDLYQLDEKELRKIRGHQIGFIPQNPNAALNPMIKIGHQLRESLVLHRISSKKESNKKIENLLSKFGFEYPKHIMNQYAFQMSGGMNQRIVSLLGLACGPRWIIADEPTKGLDAIVRKQVYQVLKKIYKENACGMIVITHDLILAQHLCEELCVMYEGEIVEQGKTSEIMNDPKHPYTQGLLKALPQNGMQAILKTPHKNKNECSECHFFNRCPQATAYCENRKMQDFEESESRKVRCFLYDQTRKGKQEF